MLALLWAPLASHCLITSVLVSDSLSCCDHQDLSAPQENDCHDACGNVENGQYHSVLQRLTIPPPALQLQFEAPLLVEVGSAPESGLVRQHPDANRTPPSSWQFLCRTALPPRAPSCFA